VSPKAPVSGGDLAQLLTALRNAPDSWSRLKLVASGAHALAKLTPQQRVQLLRQLGLQGAEELAEAAAGSDTQTASAMTQALRALEDDPRRLQQLVGAIADPKSRRTTLMGLGAHVIEAVTEPPAPAAKASAAKAAVQTGGVARAAAAPPPPSPPAPAKAAAPPKPAAPAATPRQAAAGVIEAAAALLTGTQPTAPQPPAPPSQPTPAQPQPATPPPSLPPTPHPTPSPPQPPPAAPQPTPPPATPGTPPSMPQPVHPVTPPAPTAEVVAEVTTPSTPAITDLAPTPTFGGVDVRPAALCTLRDLRRRLTSGEAFAADEVTTLFAEELPQGWARRRALAALFAQRRPEALDDALALVAQVSSTVDRRWALADLAASRPWADGDWERLVAAAGGTGERRRLALRRRKA